MLPHGNLQNVLGYAGKSRVEHDYWHERWALNQIGFHQAEINPLLQRFWPELNLVPGDEVLVPLCGKSKDMLWLHQQGHKVLGVELSPHALAEFIAENGLTGEPVQHAHYCGYDLPDMTLLCGDFFKLSRDDCQDVRGVYDRAALVALPGAMRADYVRHLLQVLPKDCQILLIGMECATYGGPPFSVDQAEIEHLFSSADGLVLLHCEESVFKGMPLVEKVYRIVV
jgi:thiopurine S-methyltransferase